VFQMSFLSQIKDFNKSALSSTTTIETDRQGRKWRTSIENGVVTKELIGENEIFKDTFKDAITYLPGTDIPSHFYRFSSDSNDWEIYEFPDYQNITVDQFKVITFNVWFSEYYMRERADALFSYCDSEDPDVICFQEVTPIFLSYLSDQSWLRDRFSLVDQKGDRLGVYGVVLAINLRLKGLEVRYVALPSKMGRSAVIADVSINGFDFKVGTVHLESMEENVTRRKQLEIISNKLSGSPSIFCGDFNIDGHASEENNSVIETFPSHDDAWSTQNPTEPGYTYTNEENALAWERVERLDRILISQTPNHWSLTTIEILGKTPICRDETENKEIYISDHFGLKSILTMSK